MPLIDYHKEPTVQVIDAKPFEFKRFLWAFAGTVLIAITVLLGASWYSNHHGYFGEYGQFGFYNDRLTKSDYLAQLRPEELPNAYIIGSSNTMPFQPTTVDTLFGVRSFNLGSFWGGAEDAWAWTNFIVRVLNQKPKLMIFGIEPWTFADDNRGPPPTTVHVSTQANYRATLGAVLATLQPLQGGLITCIG